MKNEFTHRGVRLRLCQTQTRSLTWTIFPAAYAEISGTVEGNEPEETTRLAVAKACEEIDAWLDVLPHGAAHICC